MIIIILTGKYIAFYYVIVVSSDFSIQYYTIALKYWWTMASYLYLFKEDIKLISDSN